MKIDEDSAQVKIPPPLMLLAAIALGLFLDFLYPLPFISRGLMQIILATFFLGAGLGIIIHSARMFRKAKTAIEPWKRTSHLIYSGAYRFSRNPIYLSFVFIGLGVGFACNNLWIIILQFPLAALIDRYAVAREERYLGEKFKEEYADYKRRVRRWI